jgi:hypothetical protein
MASSPKPLPAAGSPADGPLLFDPLPLRAAVASAAVGLAAASADGHRTGHRGIEAHAVVA